VSSALPLGIDIGTARIRVARAVVDAGSPRLVAICARDIGTPDDELLSALVEELVREVGGRERRCVVAIRSPHAALRAVDFPPMTSAERRRSALFEVRRFAPWDINATPTSVLVQPLGAGAFAVGAIQKNVVQRMGRLLRKAGLRLIAVDHESLALRRAFPNAGAIVDIGADRSSVHVFDESVPRTMNLSCGGSTVTRGIANDLNVDDRTAEKRKRIVGPAGAGVQARDEGAAAVAQVIATAQKRSTLRCVTMTGNGARLPGLAEAIEREAAIVVDRSVSPLLEGSDYSSDVIRSAGPDWSLAAALATWSTAE